jgi:hypothetical protein
VSSIGEPDANGFAAETLKLLSDVAGLSQCTVFAYAFRNWPSTMSVADHRSGRYLRDVADTNASRFYVLDGSQRIMTTAGPRRRPSDNGLMLHQQTIDEIEQVEAMAPMIAHAAPPLRTVLAGADGHSPAHAGAPARNMPRPVQART